MIDPWRMQYDLQVYRVGSYSTPSKLLAFQNAGCDTNSIVFDWNDAFWKAQDWSEPSESMDDLCLDLARLIRDSFKKIYVSFSGGWDSWTVCDYFHRAGLAIDGFLLIHRSWMIENEWQTIIDQTEWIKKTWWPRLDVRIIRYNSSQFVGSYSTLGEDWIYQPGWNQRFSKNTRRTVLNSQNLSQNIVQDAHSIVLDGNDKPRLDIMAGKWCSRLLDNMSYFFHASPTFPFFINTIAPKIHIKQCYMLARFLLSKNITTHQELHQWQTRSSMHDKEYREKNQAIGRRDPDRWIMSTAFLKRTEDTESFQVQTAENLARAAGVRVKDKVSNIYTKGLSIAKQKIPILATQGNLPGVFGSVHKLQIESSSADLSANNSVHHLS